MCVKNSADILGFFLLIKYLNGIGILKLGMCLYMLVLNLHLT